MMAGAILLGGGLLSAYGMIDKWHKYVQKQMRDSFHMLDEKLIFANTKPNKKDYASKRLPYPLEAGSTEAYDRIMSVLYSESNHSPQVIP